MNENIAKDSWEKLVSKAVRNQDLCNTKFEVELRQILYANHRIKALEEQLNRATRALERAGFEDLGGQEWKPPLGKPPTFIEAAPGWVSVNERLPEATTDILWKDKFGCVGRCHFTPESRLHSHIIYWIQEPNLPKSEGSDKQARVSWDDYE